MTRMLRNITCLLLAAAPATAAAAAEGWVCEAELCIALHRSWDGGWTTGRCRAEDTYEIRRLDDLEQRYVNDAPHIFGEAVDWIAAVPGDPLISRRTYGCRQLGSLLRCRGPEGTMRMSPDTLRFLAIYETGYVEGDDPNAAVGPAMIAGTCRGRD